MPKIQKTLTVQSKHGLHARPAAVFVQIANKYQSTVVIRRSDGVNEEVNGKSIMGMLMLGADHGCQIMMTVDGDDAEKMFAELEAYLVKEE